jgi:glycosyltransferase involved in cell wall biosynthesis
MLDAVVMCPMHRADDLVRVLDNFSAQSHAQKSLVVVENGDAVGACEVFGENRLRIFGDVHVVHCGHQHQSTARNVGLRYIRQTWGPTVYVANMDSDDLYGADYLAEHVGVAVPGHVNVKQNGWVQFDEALVFLGQYWRPWTYNTGSCNGGTIGGFAGELPDYPIVAAAEEHGFLASCRERGLKVINLTAKHYVYNRTGGRETHTWKGRAEKLLRASSGWIWVDSDPLYVVDSIPAGPPDVRVPRWIKKS